MLRSHLSRQVVRRYTISTVNGNPGKVSILTVKVHGGSRYAEKDGLAHLLSRFNYQNTNGKSSLRLVRESELLGGKFESMVDREFITLKATFLSENLPYFVNAMGNVLYKTTFRPHELVESVFPAANYDSQIRSMDPIAKAQDALYNITYRTGLGNPVLYDGVQSISLDDIKNYSNKVYTKENINIIGEGIEENSLKKFVQDSLISSLPNGKALKSEAVPKAYSGESRVRATGESVVGIGIPLKKADIPLFEVLSTYLTCPLFPGFESVHSSFVDTYHNSYGLFQLYLKGTDAGILSKSLKSIVGQLKKNNDIAKAMELAKIKMNEVVNTEIIKPFKLDGFNYVAVGDTSKLPFKEEL
ncbi:hypothetical protein KAFR_0B00230 [Kazachstania africana CBS 2517]|uniref:Cytochrome b-c1 complex subunit 2, mitochondrial n=1 Tax=Kazachstania africana (strain ATCC 22294 / BCRC 22015 / CBS 2517 / CECT 1963 / NBRC 1671 / NRRL Y-8276) TaxID=1071382 RepID=H2APM3_KAZAF|nr:hypothetical protein KAFR_0B00230 [Kazachstania africana CBS 2517]CCF56323.1 hypothetical protein KAFR_0B00230 [Kazachstania africana CBS 2517]